MFRLYKNQTLVPWGFDTKTRKVEKGSRGNFFCRKINIFFSPGLTKNGERFAPSSGRLLTVLYLQKII